VLGRFTADETVVLEKVLDRSVEQTETWLSDGLAKAMNLYNGSVA
jgi:peptidyl-tRNA hydrolase